MNTIIDYFKRKILSIIEKFEELYFKCFLGNNTRQCLFFRDAAEVFIESDKWLDAMKCEFKNPATGIRDTPLRMLIKSFPDLASKVFDKCMQTNLQGTQDTDTKVM